MKYGHDRRQTQYLIYIYIYRSPKFQTLHFLNNPLTKIEVISTKNIYAEKNY